MEAAIEQVLCIGDFLEIWLAKNMNGAAGLVEDLLGSSTSPHYLIGGISLQVSHAA